MLSALAFGMGKSCPRFLGLDLPILQIVPRRVPERRLRNEGLQTRLCTDRAPATLNDNSVNTVALCTHDTSSYTRLCSGCECCGKGVSPQMARRDLDSDRLRQDIRVHGNEVADAACEYKQMPDRVGILPARSEKHYTERVEQASAQQ